MIDLSSLDLEMATRRQSCWPTVWAFFGLTSLRPSVLVGIGWRARKKMSSKKQTKESDDAWVFDSLVGFLRGPVWNLPILTFIEHRSLSKKNWVKSDKTENDDFSRFSVFEPDTEENEAEYKKIHDEYKNLVINCHTKTNFSCSLKSSRWTICSVLSWPTWKSNHSNSRPPARLLLPKPNLNSLTHSSNK